MSLSHLKILWSLALSLRAKVKIFGMAHKAFHDLLPSHVRLLSFSYYFSSRSATPPDWPPRCVLKMWYVLIDFLLLMHIWISEMYLTRQTLKIASLNLFVCKLPLVFRIIFLFCFTDVSLSRNGLYPHYVITVQNIVPSKQYGFISNCGF